MRIARDLSLAYNDKTPTLEVMENEYITNNVIIAQRKILKRLL